VTEKLLRWLDIAVYAVFAAFAFIVGPRDVWWFVGLSLATLTVPVWFASRWHLGASFSASAQARKLVTTGPYAKFRHPVYVFGSVAWAGALMGLLGWRAIVIWVFIVLVEAIRVRREERVLAEAFGEEWAAYKASTWF